MQRSDLPPLLPDAPRQRAGWRVALVLLALAAAFGVALFMTYCVESHHADRGSIWWPEQCRDLIPPAATGITLQRDLLDHYATYTIAEKDLNAFLDQRFAREGEVLDSFATRRPVTAADVGRKLGRLEWVVPHSAVVYGFAAANGAMHEYYHDPVTGQTYQASAYW